MDKLTRAHIFRRVSNHADLHIRVLHDGTAHHHAGYATERALRIVECCTLRGWSYRRCHSRFAETVSGRVKKFPRKTVLVVFLRLTNHFVVFESVQLYQLLVAPNVALMATHNAASTKPLRLRSRSRHASQVLAPDMVASSSDKH